MNKYKVPDFITEKNFNNETFELIEMEKSFLQKLSSQHTFQMIIDYFQKNKNLEEISLDVTEEYNDEGGDILCLNCYISLKNEEEEVCDELQQEIYDYIANEVDGSVLSRIKDIDGIIIIRDDIDSFKSLAGVLFSTEEDVELYFKILSGDDGTILPIDCITAKNINSFDSALIYSGLEHLHDLDCQIAVLSVKKLFDDPDLNYVEISAEDDENLDLTLDVGLRNDKVCDDEYIDNIRDVLGDVIDGRMLRNLVESHPVKIEKNDVGGIKGLVDVLFGESSVGNDFLTVLLRGELEDNIEITNNVSRSKAKV